jgi:hypothetical protein
MDINCVLRELGTEILYASCTGANNSHVETVKYLINKNYGSLINVKNCTY